MLLPRIFSLRLSFNDTETSVLGFVVTVTVPAIFPNVIKPVHKFYERGANFGGILVPKSKHLFFIREIFSFTILMKGFDKRSALTSISESPAFSQIKDRNLQSKHNFCKSLYQYYTMLLNINQNFFSTIALVDLYCICNVSRRWSNISIGGAVKTTCWSRNQLLCMY